MPPEPGKTIIRVEIVTECLSGQRAAGGEVGDQISRALLDESIYGMRQCSPGALASTAL